MDDIYFFPLFIIGFVFLFFIITKKVSSVLPEKYSLLKQQYPNPLYSYGWLSGRIKLGLVPLNFQGLLKIDVYEKMVIVSSLGQGLCLPYDKYIFEQKQFLFYHYLIVKTLSESGGYQEKPKTILEIKLSSNKINTILSLAQK